MPASAGSSGQVLSFDGSGGITPATAAVQDSGTGRVDISQINDTAGLRIIGFDDQNDHELDFYIDSGGYANIDADQGFRYKQGGTNVSYISADGGNGLRMYDNIPLTFGATGATRFGFERNSVSGNLLLGYNEMNTTLWTVTPTGQLGIGATPSSDLHVEGTTTGANDGVLRVVNNTATAGHDAMRIMMPSAASGALNFSNNSGQYWRWFLGSAGEMRFDSNDGTSKFYMTNTGEARIPDALRVGSNASAASPLHVYQNDTATGSTAGITVEQDGTGHAVVQFLRTGSERWMIGVDGSNYFRITDGSSLGATDFFVVEPVTGYVGFGQAVPQSGIHCSTGARFDGQGISVGALTNSSTQGVIRCQTALDFYNGGRIEYDYAGTTGQVLTFENNGTEVMRLDGSGNVGIGDIAPATKLHVVGPDGAGTTPTLDPDTMSIFQNNGLVSDHCRVSIIAGASAQSSLNFGDAIDENAGYITYDHNVNKMYLRTNGAGNDLTISNNNQIGINETSPEATLHVVGPDGAGTTPTIDAFGTVGIFENNSDFASNSYISLIAGTDGLAGINFGDEDDENIGRIDYDHLNDELKFWTNTSQRMVITSSGSVGIGTASPTSGYRMTISSSAALTSGLVVEGSGNAIILDDINNYTGLGTADFTAYNGTNFAQFGTAAGHTAVFTGGNVGIGTQTPATLLTMEEAVSVSTPMLTIHANTSTTEAGGAIDFANSSQVSAIGARIASHRLGAGAYSDLRFSVLPSGGSLTEAMRIDSTGYVGIGDTAPGHLLEIADGFRTAPVSSPSHRGGCLPPQTSRLLPRTSRPRPLC